MEKKPLGQNNHFNICFDINYDKIYLIAFSRKLFRQKRGHKNIQSKYFRYPLKQNLDTVEDTGKILGT